MKRPIHSHSFLTLPNDNNNSINNNNNDIDYYSNELNNDNNDQHHQQRQSVIELVPTTFYSESSGKTYVSYENWFILPHQSNDNNNNSNSGGGGSVSTSGGNVKSEGDSSSSSSGSGGGSRGNRHRKSGGGNSARTIQQLLKQKQQQQQQQQFDSERRKRHVLVNTLNDTVQSDVDDDNDNNDDHVDDDDTSTDTSHYSSSSSSSESSSDGNSSGGSDDAKHMYDPHFLDDPKIRNATTLKMMHLPGLISSTVPFIKKRELEMNLNEQFRQKHPDIQLTLSKIRSLKRKMLRVCFPPTPFVNALNMLNLSSHATVQENVFTMECSTVAMAVVYLEKLILKSLVRNENRRLVAVTCLFIAFKLNYEGGGSNLDKHFEQFWDAVEDQFPSISKKQVLKFEFQVFAMLDFDINVPLGDLYPHMKRLLNQVNGMKVVDYLGEDLFHRYIGAKHLHHHHDDHHHRHHH